MEISSENISKQDSIQKGGLRTMPFIIVNEAFERVASVGLRANMILYLKNEYHFSTATGANIMFLWGAISNFMPTLGAFLSDSYLGRFRVIGIGSIISLIGMSMVWLTAVFPTARPDHCNPRIERCTKPNEPQIALLFISFATMSIGSGGIRPCSLAFGADQFDRPENTENAKILQRFFNWYYASVGISVMISVTVIVYIQTVKGWILGFGVPAALMLFSTVMFFMGSSLYIKVKANKSLFTGFFQVAVASFKNKNLDFPPKNSDDGFFHHKKGSKIHAPSDKIRTSYTQEKVNIGSGPPGSKVRWFRSASNESRFINTVTFDSKEDAPTLVMVHGYAAAQGFFFRNFDALTKHFRVIAIDQLGFLNKACILRNPEKDLTPTGSAVDPWSLCTVKQVEELKALIKVIPIWSASIMIAVTVSQHSFPVLQANSMDRHVIGNFKIPPGSFDVFSLLTLTIWVALYDQLLVRQISKLTKRPEGLSLKQRMGIGLFLSCLCMAVAAMVERKRRNAAISQGLSNDPFGVVNMSAFWLVPQHCLLGLAEAFNAIGQIEFYYSQFPKSMASIGVALFALGMAVGNLVASLIVGAVNEYSKQGGRVSWVSNNLNQGHYDYYYGVLAILSVANFFYFLGCSWAYGPCDETKHWGLEEEEEEEKEVQVEKFVKGSSPMHHRV